MSDKVVSHEESMVHAVRYMLRFVRKEVRDVRHLKGDVKHELKDSKKNKSDAERKDAQHVEKDIYAFLYHNMRAMHGLIEVEKDQDYVEQKHDIKNPYKSKIAHEVTLLLKELRRIGILDEKSL